ncbi:MAG: tetratricopeptide repeat protein [Xanthomonadales bacterium]|nr:tetratricopeptide repeat protein [Xanthomonadales bacterium]NIN59826.1 tetratricopeptide repeat protein [Xanthomonadales bacterium]NIN75201.1 tetratricopeptide repeat protein [Xanthomonadales bacterium]NIO13446.1 tetratricopeptide repeat protein [Xanthomonadales bacterium]NIP12219.1 tetratricopeptide repeat protein [Xanthomonadales bacterium]
MSLFVELKRRNVFRVGIAYLLGGWVLLQGADFALDVVGAPDWIIQALVVLAIVGLPAVLIFAWVFEMTPEGLKREKDVVRGSSIAPQTGRRLDRVIIAFLVVAVGVLLVDRFMAGPGPAQGLPTEPAVPTVPVEAVQTPTAADRPSVAVLPFAFRSTNPEDEFFAEGIHDDLLTQLAKIGSLKVISRTSVMEYKDTTKKIPDIARELGVATIVEGGVQRSGSRVRINAQLIDADSDEHLWAETFNRELTAENLFEIQAEISLAIADALQATLSPEEEAQIGRVLTDDLQAWESYQRALRLRDSASSDRIVTGLAEIEHTLSLDPGFAAAWSLKAIMLLQRFWFYDPDPALRDQALAAIDRGRSLDAALPEHDIAQGYYHYWGFLDYERALAALDRALAAMPGNTRIHEARAYVLRRQGHFDQALDSLRKASELSPRQGNDVVEIGSTLLSLGRFDEAWQAFEKARGLMSEDNQTLMANLGDYSLWRSGDTRMARYYYGRALGAYPDVFQNLWLATLGDRDLPAALQAVENWPENMLEVRIFHFTRPMLRGLTEHLIGDRSQARAPLLDAEQYFLALLANAPANFTALKSLCQVQGALGRRQEAGATCRAAGDHLPDDAFIRANHLFQLAVGPALAGDTEHAFELLNASLALGCGPSMHHLHLHPAFDALRPLPAYAELERRYPVPPP